MRLISMSLLLFTIPFFQGCQIECGECVTPPASFAFELVDKESGENLFANGTYNSDDIEILNLADNSAVEFRFIAVSDINIIEINSIGWKTEIVNYSFNVSNNYVIC